MTMIEVYKHFSHRKETIIVGTIDECKRFWDKLEQSSIPRYSGDYDEHLYVSPDKNYCCISLTHYGYTQEISEYAFYTPLSSPGGSYASFEPDDMDAVIEVLVRKYGR